MAAARNVFTIPAGRPFLKTLVQSLCDGRLIAGYKYDEADPLALAGITIFVPTRRSARVGTAVGAAAPGTRLRRVLPG